MLGIVTDLFLTESDIVLWPPPGYCLRTRQWALCPLELYRSGNMVRLGRFALSLPTSSFFNLPPFHSPFLGAPRGPDVTTSPLPYRGYS